MESGKHSNSDTSSEEIDQLEKLNDDNTGIGRSYECTFCKRGFTNAQALGGHMNIHRKDKAKAKQKNQEASHATKKSHEDYTSSKYFAPVSRDQHQYNTAVGAYMSYQVYCPASNPSYLHAYHQLDLPSSRPEHLRQLHEYRMDQGLSLRIGPPHMEDGEERMNNRHESDIDLELRLGHHP